MVAVTEVDIDWGEFDLGTEPTPSIAPPVELNPVPESNTAEISWDVTEGTKVCNRC